MNNNENLFPEGVVSKDISTLIKVFDMFAKKTETQNAILSDINENTKDTIDFFKNREGLVQLLNTVMTDSTSDLNSKLDTIKKKLDTLYKIEQSLESVKNSIVNLSKFLLLRISLIIISGTSAFAAIVYLINMFMQ